MSYLGRKFYVLMWKNLIVRKRSWFLTLFEIVIPIALFYMIAWSKQDAAIGQSKQEVPATINEVFTEKQIDDYAYLHHDRVQLAFAPNTAFSKRIIEEFNKTLVPIMMDGSKLHSFEVFDSEEKLEKYFFKEFENRSTFTNVIGFGVVLEHTGDDLPKDFKYKIRSTIPLWENKETFPQFIPAGPTSEGDKYIDKGFVAIQLAVDNAYIKVAQGGSPPVPYSRSIQKFPFPKYEADFFYTGFKIVMPLLTMLSFVTISISTVKKVVEEKVSGVTELMKMMGLQTWMVWIGWVLNGLMVYAVTCGVITWLLCFGFSSAKSISVISHINCTIVFTLFLMFCIASIFFCFAISAFFMKPTIAMTAGMIIWIVSYTLFQNYVGNVGIPFGLYLLMSLVPIFNMSSAYVIIASFESREVDVSWFKLFSSADGTMTSSLGFIMIMFLVQMFVYFCVTWYVTSIHPGPYGRAEPWYFIFQIFKNRNGKRKGMLDNYDDDDGDRFEAPSEDLKVGLKIQDLRKVFNGNFVAVDKVNLDIYENQITALLGHNGAGKTTTMSILTGMYSPTSGAVYARDYNIFDHMDRFRSSLGLCPQHNLLFPYLTAIEHLIFFGMLKGMTKKLAEKEGLQLLKILNITEKKNVLADKLSGGMKRKVSLAIALIGTPQVLVLDEPTSGMDPESRREMWDLLLKLRDARRTIIITTHFMEEADVLGDRIAIMDHGKVKCYGTSLFLKRAYGTGYQLTVTKDASSSVEPITSVIKEYAPEAQLKTTHSTQVTYSVPQKENLNLSSMFKAIESRKSSLGISGVGISCTTMEEVFLKVGQLCREEKEEYDKTSSHSNKEQHMVRNTSVEALTYKKRTGFGLMVQQFTSLLRKRSLFSIRRPIASIIFFAMPLLLMLLTIRDGTVDSTKGLVDPPLNLQLSLYGETEAYVSGPQTDKALYEKVVESLNPDSSVNGVDADIVKYLMQIGEENIARYKLRVIVAANFNTTSSSATALYNGLAYHSLPISVNLISNALLRSNEKTQQNTISTINSPLDLVNAVGSCTNLNEINQMITAVMWLILVPIGIKGFLMDLITFPHNERTSSAKQLQLMAGVPPIIYWLACFTWDYFLYLISTLGVILIIVLSDTGNLFTSMGDYGVFVLILLLFGVSGIFSTYMFSFLAKSSNMAGALFSMFTLATGTIAPLVMLFLMKLKDNDVISSGLIKPIHYLLCLEPQYAFGSTIMDFSLLLTQKSACEQCTSKEKADLCQDIDERFFLGFTSKTNPNGILQYLLFLAFDWILYLALILLIEYGYLSKACHWLKGQWVGKDFDRLIREDSDVRDERDRVDAARGGRDDNVVLTVDGLAKKFSRSFAAVQGVSFRVSAGECFGLLGVNGAGKTTTFRMLTGDETPTAGSASIMNYDLVKYRTKYLAQIGYCPQFDGINGFLTGEEVLRLFANLRGMPQDSMQSQIDEWISVLGLEEYRHRQCGKYSGGNKRKLSTAMALIGDPPVVFLDEPTTGVDPVARRNLWDVLARCQKSGQAIVLTSHSMEECEALCTRLTIMVKGRMKCIGSNQYLKQRYGQGYTLMVKLDPKYSKKETLDQLKDAIQSRFISLELKDEHQSLLQYHLNDTTIQLSKLFQNMEELQQTHNIIEDFMVSDTTLEQVFIAFARQRDEY